LCDVLFSGRDLPGCASDVHAPKLKHPCQWFYMLSPDDEPASPQMDVAALFGILRVLLRDVVFRRAE
jgi:hypothetical protein